MQDGTEIIPSTQAVKRIPLRYIFVIIIIIDMHVRLQFLGLIFKVICLLFFQCSEQQWSGNVIEFDIPMNLVWLIKMNLIESCIRVQNGKRLCDIFMV